MGHSVAVEENTGGVNVLYSRDWGYCLDDEPSQHPFNFPVLPPGVMYDIDHQCRLQYGPDAEFCEGIDVSDYTPTLFLHSLRVMQLTYIHRVSKKHPTFGLL